MLESKKAPPKNRKLLVMSASHYINTAASHDDLMNDAVGLMSIVRGSLDALAATIGGHKEPDQIDRCGIADLLRGLGYLSEIASNMADAAHSSIMATSREVGHD